MRRVLIATTAVVVGVPVLVALACTAVATIATVTGHARPTGRMWRDGLAT